MPNISQPWIASRVGGDRPRLLLVPCASCKARRCCCWSPSSAGTRLPHLSDQRRRRGSPYMAASALASPPPPACPPPVAFFLIQGRSLLCSSPFILLFWQPSLIGEAIIVDSHDFVQFFFPAG
eukprot:EG_transcript_17131